MRRPPARLLVPAMLVCALGACGDDLSNERVEKLVKAILQDQGSEHFCMNDAKIKKYGSNNLLQEIAEKDFPIVFAEEEFVKWSPEDEHIAIVLLGEGDIDIHQGGYEQSSVHPGHPGEPYSARSYDQAVAVFDDVRKRGALVSLTPKGQQAHVWTDDGFCVDGRWSLESIIAWTTPAADSGGRIISHITAKLSFEPTQVGQAPVANPFGAILTRTQEMLAVKYGSGWRIDDAGLKPGKSE